MGLSLNKKSVLGRQLYATEVDANWDDLISKCIVKDGSTAMTGAFDETKGSNIASATTTDIGAATGNFVHITGTTTITAFGTAAAGTRRIIEFDGILTLTHNATSLMCPGKANITTAAGDVALCLSEGSGNWKVAGYFRYDGSPISSGLALENIVEDTTPQLGGPLDLNGEIATDGAHTATGDGTTTVDWNSGHFHHFTFGAFNETFTFTAPTSGEPCTLIMRLVQDSVGSRTATWPASVKWAGGTAPTLTTTATTGTDIITFYYDGTSYHGVSTLDLS